MTRKWEDFKYYEISGAQFLIQSFNSARMMEEMFERTNRQRTVAQWCLRAFGAEQANSVAHRGLRLLEEAIEAAQAAGVPQEQAAKLVAFVYARPPGALHQELGGVGVTVLALAEAARLDADDCERQEVARVLAKPIEHFQARNKAKDDAGFKP